MRRGHQSKIATYDELLAELEEKKSTLLLHEAALSAVVGGTSQAAASVRGDGRERIIFRLFDAERAHGGIVLEVHTEPGKRNYVRPWYLTGLVEAWSKQSILPPEVRDAINKLDAAAREVRELREADRAAGRSAAKPIEPSSSNVYATDDAMLAHLYGGAKLTLAPPTPAFAPSSDSNKGAGK